MKRLTLAAALVAASCTTAMADVSLAITLDLEDAAIATVSYDCDTGDDVTVSYISSDTEALALVPVDDDLRVFVNVIAASGSRYVAGQYEWWTKGDTAMMNDLLTDESLRKCTTGQ